MPSTLFEVRFTEGAQRDLESIDDYIAEADSVANADRVLDQLAKAIDGLALFPERGAYPKELIALGIREYRQSTFKPYRLIYRVAAPCVYIHVIVDGRRDMQALLARRLLSD